MKQPSLLYRCALALALIAGLQLAVLAISRSDRLFSLLIYAQTGRNLPPSASAPTLPPPSTNSTSPTQTTQQSAPTQAPEAVVSFSDGALSLIGITYQCGYRPDLAALLRAPLDWDLTGAEPTVLIVHTHTTESYTGDHDYAEPYRSLDGRENMLAIGDEVARVLELGGIQVLHDRTVHDYPGYSGAYSAARATVRSYLEAYPSIRLVLDLHRDAAGDGDAGQLVTAATVGGQRSAQLMMVVGTDAGGSPHPNWQENLALALKLTALLEQENPGITRPVSLRSGRYNMDLSPGSLLVEVGAAGNTRQEALIAANALAQAILQLAKGSR